jgi:hypothetical protein
MMQTVNNFFELVNINIWLINRPIHCIMDVHNRQPATKLVFGS